MTDTQRIRLYRQAYRRMSRDLDCSSWDWPTLRIVSPTWYETLRQLSVLAPVPQTKTTFGVGPALAVSYVRSALARSAAEKVLGDYVPYRV